MLLKPFRNPYYRGPVSDHFDGRRFFNPGGEMPASLRAIWEWRRAGTRIEWPAEVPSPIPSAKPPERVTGEAARVTAIGHASFLYQTAGLNLLVDPLFSERCAAPLGPKRHNPPGIAFDDLPPIDVVLVTHSHYDHMDAPSLKRLHARHQPRVLAPLGCDALIRRWCRGAKVSAHDWDERVALSPDLAVTFAPTNHWSARGILDRRMTLWASFAFETPAGLLYHVGDSGFGGGANYRRAHERFGAPALAVLPIGAYEPRSVMRPQHQDPDEAVRAALFLGANLALGHHWGTFQLTDEAVEDPLRRLTEACLRHGLALERFRPARPGLAVELPVSIDAPPPPALPVTPETTAPTPR